MGRGYIVDDSVERSLVQLQPFDAACITGLLVGQCSGQRDFVVLAARTPQREREGQGCPVERRDVSSSGDVDVEWVTEHARQVSRMLPGGLSVLGLFLITPPDLSKEAQNTLRRLIFAVEKHIWKGRLWNLSADDVSERVGLHVCSRTRKAVCRTFDVKDPKCSAKPADWKYQTGVSASWPVLTCSVQLDLHFPAAGMSSDNLVKAVRDGLQRWAEQIKTSLCLINGKCASSDFELLSGQKKTVKGVQPRFRAQILIPSAESLSEQRSCASVQVCSGILAVTGVVHCRAHIHTNKPKSKQAAEAIKRDLMNTVSSRTEMLFEDLLMNEGDGDKGVVHGRQVLPRRVLVPLPSAGFSLCDYMFPDESVADVRERLKEMLDLDAPEEDIDVTQEVIIDYSGLNSEDCKDCVLPVLTEAPQTQTVLRRYVGVAMATGVGLLAMAAALLYLTD